MSDPKLRNGLIDALLAKHGTPTGDGRASLHACEGTKFHSPTPLITYCHQITEVKRVWLCPQCLSKLQVFIWLHKQDPGAMTWDVMREFGNSIRMLGQEIISRVQSRREEEPHA